MQAKRIHFQYCGVLWYTVVLCVHGQFQVLLKVMMLISFTH